MKGISTPHRVRFGVFELDRRAGELRKHDNKIRLQEQPLQILLMLLEHPGNVVLREEIRKRLWPNDTIVEFDHSINAAIKRLRDALGDSAEEPRFVETVARRGYRFIGEVETEPAQSLELEAEPLAGATTPVSGDLTGKTVSHYRLIEKVGRGGMGEVYRARDTRLGRDVALKVLPQEFAEDPSRRDRFEREARAVAALNHPNILALFDIGTEGGLPYMVTEFVEGETLRTTQVAMRRAVTIAAQAADGLAAAHAAGVTHRDIKPDNIMVTTDGRVKILDFGLAKLKHEAAPSDAAATVRQTEPGAVMGTVGYMSPEQVSGGHTDHRTDIFSFGAVLYELLSGKRAFQRDSAVEEMNAILKEDPPELPVSTPTSLRDIVVHCLEKKPEHRFQSAQDLAFALRAAGGRSSASLEVLTPAPGTPMRRAWMWAAAGLLLVVVLTGGVMAVQWASAVSDSSFDPIRLTRFAGEAGEEQNPAFSPDGRSVAYLRYSTGSPEILVQPVDSPTPVTLVRSPLLGLTRVLWTADGTRVCYFVQVELWCVGAAGGTPQRLLSNVVGADFTRDGKSLIFFRREIPRRLYIGSPPGAEPKPVNGMTFPESVGPLQFETSPDGKTLLVVTANPGVGAGDVWMIPYIKGVNRKLANPDHTQVIAARWFPDSRHVALVEILTSVNSYRLVIADTQSESRRLVVRDTGFMHGSVAVSPDGRRILYSMGQPDPNIFEYSMDGKRLRPMAVSSNQEINPMWSSSGDRFLYTVLTSGGKPAWWTRNADGSGAAVFTAQALSAWPRYSPDGRRIAYVTSPLVSSSPGVETLPSEGGRPVRIVASQAGQNLCWSPDGEWLWYSQGGKFWKVPSQGGQPVLIADRIVPIVDCSPDGRWIAFTSPDGLHLISPEGTKDHVLTGLAKYNSIGVSRIGSFGDGGKVLYLVHNNMRAMDVLDVETGKVLRTIDFELDAGDGIGWFSIHPDGKRMLIHTAAPRLDLWMAEGFAQPAKGWKSWFRHWEIPSSGAESSHNVE